MQTLIHLIRKQEKGVRKGRQGKRKGEEGRERGGRKG
jgi:hypothetical protein